ncbi:MAG: glycosyltransferase, partial [Rhizobiaceae bacterium]|nr:glycosyltransferase [Rhizobiaceae bacterium]
GDAVIPMDVDLQDPIEVVPQMLGRWIAGADVVLGKRRERRSDSRLKRGTASLFYKFHNAISHPRIEENVGDFRLLSRQTVEHIKQMPERNIFMKGILSWVGGRTEVVEYSRPPRVAGASKFNGWKLWNLALEGITSFSTLPLRIWTYLGLAISSVSIVYAFWMVVDKLINGNPVPGYPSLITAVLFLGGVQIVGIGVIGEYIGRIYIESKRRPRYLIQDVVTRQDIQPARQNATKRHLRPVEATH